MHSLHAYFLRRGDFNAPIVYDVDRSRDGHSFTNRRVIAIQHGEQIFNMIRVVPGDRETASSTRSRCRRCRRPRSCRNRLEALRPQLERMPARVKRFVETPRPFEFKMVQPVNPLDPRRQRHRGRCGSHVGAASGWRSLHRRLLAYVSDFYLLDTAALPHGLCASATRSSWRASTTPCGSTARLRVDDWLLYALDSPSASGARGFTVAACSLATACWLPARRRKVWCAGSGQCH